MGFAPDFELGFNQGLVLNTRLRNTQLFASSLYQIVGPLFKGIVRKKHRKRPLLKNEQRASDSWFLFCFFFSILIGITGVAGALTEGVIPIPSALIMVKKALFVIAFKVGILIVLR